MVVEMDHPTAGWIRTLGIPYRLSETPAAINRPPPTLGAHTDAVLSDLLNLTPEEIDRHRRDGVI